MKQSTKVLTVGHSTLGYERFLHLIRQAGVTAIADVRSKPFSRYCPHFSRDALHRELKADGIAYVFLGGELGGRPAEARFMCDGVADYEAMALAPTFKAGIDRVIKGSDDYRIALMCSEHNPLDCHRCLLVGRSLKERQIPISHILPSGNQRSQQDIEAELLAMFGKEDADMFASAE